MTLPKSIKHKTSVYDIYGNEINIFDVDGNEIKQCEDHDDQVDQINASSFSQNAFDHQG